MSSNVSTAERTQPTDNSGWQELWRKEDWWSVWLGLGLVAYLLFANGTSIAWLAVTPAKWVSFSDLGAHFSSNAPRYVAQFGAWLVLFTFATATMGHRARAFIPAFAFVYVLRC